MSDYYQCEEEQTEYELQSDDRKSFYINLFYGIFVIIIFVCIIMVLNKTPRMEKIIEFLKTKKTLVTMVLIVVLIVILVMAIVNLPSGKNASVSGSSVAKKRVTKNKKKSSSKNSKNKKKSSSKPKQKKQKTRICGKPCPSGYEKTKTACGVIGSCREK